VSADVRPAAAADWEEIARVCAQAGAAGEPVAPGERAAFLRHWLEPYRELRPGWTFVAVFAGRVEGYLTASPDTFGFEKERLRVFDPAPDSRGFFPRETLLKLWSEHPAHFLLNVAPGSRGRGTGSALLRALFAALRRERVPSAHAICGPDAAAWLERRAFRAAASVEPAPGVFLRAMTRPVD
jgi:GNAT superfamily N-acetyltransferase